MQSLTGKLMSGDRTIATVKNGIITETDDTLLPLYLKRTKNIEGWLVSRAIDSHRTNSRLLKKALRLRATDVLLNGQTKIRESIDIDVGTFEDENSPINMTPQQNI